MQAVFAHRISNIEHLMVGVARVKGRGAKEASILLVTGEPGLGKTAAMRWYVTQERSAIYLRAKAGWTRHWFLGELVTELGHAPARTSEELFSQAKRALAQREYVLVIDEVEHALGNTQVLEGIRDLVDLLWLPVVLVGMGEVRNRIARHPQIQSRIATVVEFGPITAEDVAIAAETLIPDVRLEADLLAELHRLCNGRMRLLLNGLAACERVAQSKKVGRLTLADVQGVELIHDWTAKKPAVQTLRRQA